MTTGKTEDRRDPEHFTDLMRHVAEAGVADRFRVLGLIPYEDLSVLMRNAVAVINPSQFEGWSTTVEEAKSMGKHVILSDIPVHREQDPERRRYVAPDDPSEMAAAIAAALSSWSRDEDAAVRSARPFGRSFAKRSARVQISDVLNKAHSAVAYRKAAISSLVSEPGATSSLFRCGRGRGRGRGGPGALVFLVGGIVLIAIIVIIVSDGDGNSPG